MLPFLWALLFLIVGIIMECCICFYHRSRENNKILQAAFLSGLITLIGITVISKIVFGMIKSSVGAWYIVYIGAFALGKSLGTFGSLKLWDKVYKRDINEDLDSLT